MTDLSEVLDVLDVEPVEGDAAGGASGEGAARSGGAAAGATVYRARNLPTPGGVVFGGQIIAQSIVAASRALEGKSVRSIHTVFARGASLDADLELAVDVLHAGRAMGSASVTASQGDRLRARATALASAEEPDFIRHEATMPAVAGPDDSPAGGHDMGWWETRIVGGVDFNDPALTGPAELQVWSRAVGDVPSGPDSQPLHQALLAYATEGFLIATAMRPHEGVGQALAHRTVSTSVLTHTVTFHDPVDATAWSLLAMESPHASRGRSYGRAQVFDQAGHHVASFTQENMIRAAPERAGSAPSKH